MRWLVALLCLASSVAIASDTIFTSDFELHCGFGVEGSRQEAAYVRLPQPPVVLSHQPMLTWDQLFGIQAGCSPVAGQCLDVFPFPRQANSRAFVKVNTEQYVALQFTTEFLEKGNLGGVIANIQDASASPGALLTYSFSDRCGDFDPEGSWLSANPLCMQTLGVKQNFGWSVGNSPPSPFACNLLKDGEVDDDQVWWFNMKVEMCSGNSTCTLYMYNSG